MYGPERTDEADEHAAFRTELVEYVGFGPADSRRLAEICPALEPRFGEFAEHFYACIDRHPHAREAITGGAAQVDRLKRTLVEWMRSGLLGPHDAEFFHRRRRIGRVHVEIGLEQRYMFTAMNVMREDFHAALQGRLPDTEVTRATHRSIDRLFDLELAIMLESYAEHQQRRLQAAQRMSTIGQLASGIGHELRNPIGVIASSLYLLGRRLPEDDRMQRHLHKMERSVLACESIISNLMDLARDRPLAAEPVDICEVLESLLDSHRALEDAKIDCRDDCEGAVLADPGLLERALSNLLVNAVQAAAPAAACIEIRAYKTDGGSVVRVRDHGPGFPPDVLNEAFEPLVTRRPGGTGLGLALVRRIAERHDGTVKASNAVDGGAVVEIFLPDDIHPA